MPQPAKFKSAKQISNGVLRRYSPRGLLIYVLAIALIPAAIIALIKGHTLSVLFDSAAFGLYCLAAVWLRKGLMAENPSPQKRLSRPSKWRFKLLSALLVAGTTGFLAFFSIHLSLPMAMLYAGGAFLGMYLSYGFDRRQNTHIMAAHGYSSEEIRKTLADALAIIEDIEQSNRSITHSELNQRIDRICEIAEGVVSELETDPRGIRRARKFLNVYLDSVRQVIRGYADTHPQAGSHVLELNFTKALDAIESAFQEQQQKLLEDDVFDLDVKIEVLTTQLKREGIM